MRKLLTIHDSFDVLGRGTVIVSADKSAKLLAGQGFLLVLANGERHNLTALRVERFRTVSGVAMFGILVGEQLQISAPISGSEIWVET